MANRFSRALRYHNARYQDGRVPPSSHSLHHDGMAFRGCHEHAAFHGMSCAICKLLSPDEPHEAGKLVNGGPALHEA